MKRPYEYYLNADTSVIQRMITSDVNNMYGLILALLQLMSEVIIFVLLAVTLTAMAPQMILTVAALLIVTLLVIKQFLKPIMRQAGIENQDYYSGLYKWIEESVMGIKEIKIANKENYFIREYGKCGHGYVSAVQKYNIFNATPRLLIETVCMAGLILYLIFMILSGEDVTSMVSQLGAFGVAAMRLLPSANRINNYLTQISYFEPFFMGVSDNLQEEINDKNVVYDEAAYRRNKPVDKLPLQDKIVLDDIVYKYPNSEVLIFDHAHMEIPAGKWSELLENNKGDSLEVKVCIRQNGEWKAYRSFPFYISPFPIDYGLVYRLLAPGYEIYSKMGIYERELSTFRQTPLFENTQVTAACVNCHAFNQTNPDPSSLHVRGGHGATVMTIGGESEFLDTKADGQLSACVYPYWHPSGEYIAYSVNRTNQTFHLGGKKPIEVFDQASDVVVYHPQSHRILTTPLLSTAAFETFPAFSPDGRTLYFCSAEQKEMPARYKEVKYSLCSIAFHPEDGTFGERIDTLISARTLDKSISFPKPSFDGKYLMFTLSDYGNFSIWHKEADLWLLDLRSGAFRNLKEVNSDDTESYHNWSSNSHWFVFSSRRDGGLYTRLYLASVDDQGRIGKPFLLPQQDPYTFYDQLIYSYNIPEFVSAPVRWDKREMEKGLISKERTRVK